MDKIEKIDKNVCGKLRVEMQKVLDKFAEEIGMTIVVGNMKFSPESVEIKLDAKIIGGKSLKERALSADLKWALQYYNFQEEKNGMRLVAFNRRQYKYPFIYEKDGKKFKCGEDFAKMAFSKD